MSKCAIMECVNIEITSNISNCKYIVSISDNQLSSFRNSLIRSL